MTKFIFALAMTVSTLLANAQYTFSSTSTDLLKRGNQESIEHEEKKQVYNISLKDMILVHNVYDTETGELYDSQIYQIAEVKEDTDGLLTFQAKSGVSGKTYEYRLSIPEGKPASLILVLPDEEFDLRYNGVVTTLKTYRQ